jgi:CRISPR-associated endonuclease Csn1
MPRDDNVQFAFDIGTNSIGWTVFALTWRGEPYRLIDAGVRIYSDGREPKSGTSLAEGRRVARGMARRRDRYKRRRRAVLNTLAEYGLMPNTVEARRALVAETNDRKAGEIAANVYALRARALDEKLPLHHLGRALFHLNQRRGFKSNRKTDRRDNDQGKIAAGISRLGEAIAAEGARTLGEFLHMQRSSGRWVRVRPSRIAVGGGKEEEGYGFYPERSFLEAEFDWIWNAQAPYYPDILTEARREHLKLVMFFQRPLKRPIVGRCSFNPEEERLPKAHPLFQEFRLLKEINELELVHRDQHHEKLTPDQRDALLTQLKSQRSAAFSALRKTIKAPFGARFNKETEARDKLKGDEVAAEMSHKGRFGQDWFSKPLDERWAVIDKLIDEDDPLAVRAWLEERYPEFTAERIDAIAGAGLPTGYGRLGPTAIAALIDELKTGTVKDDIGREVVLTERQAIERVWGDNPIVQRQVKGLDELLPYQEIVGRRIAPGTDNPDDPYDVRKGRITNPTIHIGLNQLRRVVNALVRRYGKPEQIAVELARELKLSEAEKQEVQRTIGKNTRDAERRSEQLRELRHVDNGYNRLLLKLWEELDPHQPLNRVCVYCGQPINIETLFSSEIDVDHILPWSRTLDDSQANRIVCHRNCNRQKGNKAPAEVALWQDRYDEILVRAERLPRNKRWRFARDAMKKFADEESFLARQLTDTQYLSRLAHEYLGSLFSDEEPDEWGEFQRRNHVRVVPGRMTEMLRRQWGLNTILSGDNSKNRNDHRHHAIDAAVIGVTTRSLLQRIATAAGGREAAALEETIGKIEPPWPGFRDDLKAAVDRIIVSHKPDHGTLPSKAGRQSTAGRLHNDTAYGFTGEEKSGTPVVTHRVPFNSIDEKMLPLIRDTRLAASLAPAIKNLSGKELAAALAKFAASGRYNGIRHVRIAEALNVVPIRDSAGRAYKGYKGDANYRYDVWELANGKWVEEVVSMFEAHDRNWTSAVRSAHPAARKVLSLHQNDMVAYEHPIEGYTIARVVKFSAGQVTFAGNREAGALKARDADKGDPFRYFYKTAGAMRDIKVRQVRVDELGHVFDPGPQDKTSRKAREADEPKLTLT